MATHRSWQLSETFFRCKYGYPKDLNERTFTDEKSYIHRPRRKDTDVDIVPYNPELLQLFNCHINVEISHSIMLVMYL